MQLTVDHGGTVPGTAPPPPPPGCALPTELDRISRRSHATTLGSQLCVAASPLPWFLACCFPSKCARAHSTPCEIIISCMTLPVCGVYVKRNAQQTAYSLAVLLPPKSGALTVGVRDEHRQRGQDNPCLADRCGYSQPLQALLQVHIVQTPADVCAALTVLEAAGQTMQRRRLQEASVGKELTHRVGLRNVHNRANNGV